MNLVERDGWIFVRLQASERSRSVDWDELIRWKIPDEDRVHVPAIDTWVVRNCYRKLVKDVYFVYLAASKAEADTQMLASAQKVLERLDGLQPHKRRMLDAGLELERRAESGSAPLWPEMYRLGLN